jgi:hypothetical protein
LDKHISEWRLNYTSVKIKAARIGQVSASWASAGQGNVSQVSEPAWRGWILWLKRRVKESMSGLSVNSAATETTAQVLM